MTRKSLKYLASLPAMPLITGLACQAGTAYVTLILAGRILGPARFGGISALYVLISSVTTGLFLPLEQEIARRRGAERVTQTGDRSLIRRSVLLGMSASAVIVVVAEAEHRWASKILDSNGNLFACLCLAIPGYGFCFIARGVFAGTGEMARYGIQLGAEGTFRLVALLTIELFGKPNASEIGWLFGLAPWVALAASLVARKSGGNISAIPDSPRIPLLGPVSLLVVSSLASQLLINAGPIVVQLLASTRERASAGAFLAALVIIRLPVLLFTAVQPSFLPALSAHATAGRYVIFRSTILRILTASIGVSVLSTLALTAVGPPLMNILFAFGTLVSRTTFLITGASVGMFLLSVILSQALLGLGRHGYATVGWACGAGGLVAGATLGGGAVTRAVDGFAIGAAASATSLGLILWALLSTAIDRADPGVIDQST